MNWYKIAQQSGMAPDVEYVLDRTLPATKAGTFEHFLLSPIKEKFPEVTYSGFNKHLLLGNWGGAEAADTRSVIKNNFNKLVKFFKKEQPIPIKNDFVDMILNLLDELKQQVGKLPGEHPNRLGPGGYIERARQKRLTYDDILKEYLSKWFPDFYNYDVHSYQRLASRLSIKAKDSDRSRKIKDRLRTAVKWAKETFDSGDEEEFQIALDLLKESFAQYLYEERATDTPVIRRTQWKIDTDKLEQCGINIPHEIARRLAGLNMGTQSEKILKEKFLYAQKQDGCIAITEWAKEFSAIILYDANIVYHQISNTIPLKQYGIDLEAFRMMLLKYSDIYDNQLRALFDAHDQNGIIEYIKKEWSLPQGQNKIAKKKAKWNQIPDECTEGDKLDTQLLAAQFPENRRKDPYKKNKGRNWPKAPGN